MQKSSAKGKASKATDSAKESIKGSSKKMGVKNYREASSDDEFAKEHFMFSSDEESFTPKSGRKRQRGILLYMSSPCNFYNS